MPVRAFNELTPEEQIEVRSKSRAFIFIASLIMVVLGAGCIIEGIYTLFRGGDFVVEQYNIDSNKAITSSLMLLTIGLIEVLCAYGTIRLSFLTWRFSFGATLLVAANRFIDTMVFHDRFLSFGSTLTLIAALIVLLFLYLGRNAISRN
jgi:hypothetical protein